VKDRDFITYIKKKEDAYEEGENVEIEMLMLQASNKYKTMVEAKTWNAPSPEDEKIIALEAQLKKMKKPNKPNKPDKPSKEKGKGKGKERSHPGKPAWMTKPPPAAGKLKTKLCMAKLTGGAPSTRAGEVMKKPNARGMDSCPNLKMTQSCLHRTPRAPSG